MKAPLWFVNSSVYFIAEKQPQPFKGKKPFLAEGRVRTMFLIEYEWYYEIQCGDDTYMVPEKNIHKNGGEALSKFIGLVHPQPEPQPEV